MSVLISKPREETRRCFLFLFRAAYCLHRDAARLHRKKARARAVQEQPESKEKTKYTTDMTKKTCTKRRKDDWRKSGSDYDMLQDPDSPIRRTVVGGRLNESCCDYENSKTQIHQFNNPSIRKCRAEKLSTYIKGQRVARKGYQRRIYEATSSRSCTRSAKSLRTSS